MLREKIDRLISEATKSGDTFGMDVLRLIKAEFLKYNASKEAVKKPMDDSIEISILNKMVKQRRESAEMYSKGNREDLADNEREEAVFIENFLPAQASVEEIDAEVDNIIASGVEPVKRNMGQIIKAVKAKFPTADGKTVSEIVSEKLS